MAFHLYTDDCISFSSNDDLGLHRSMSNIEKCLMNIDLWMTANKWELNKDKTELIYVYSKYNSQKSFTPLLTYRLYETLVIWVFYLLHSTNFLTCGGGGGGGGGNLMSTSFQNRLVSCLILR